MCTRRSSSSRAAISLGRSSCVHRSHATAHLPNLETTMKRLGVDVGGTFTDLIYVDDEAGSILIHKIASTPDDPSRGTVQGIKELSEQANVTPADLDQVFHGTTIATNIVIEHNGATVGMITTEGYRDILHIARHKKPLNFSNYQD